jgi:hypothetical protein
MERGWQRCCTIIFACTALPGEEKDVGSCVPKSDELVTSSSPVTDRLVLNSTLCEEVR